MCQPTRCVQELAKRSNVAESVSGGLGHSLRGIAESCGKTVGVKASRVLHSLPWRIPLSALKPPFSGGFFYALFHLHIKRPDDDCFYLHRFYKKTGYKKIIKKIKKYKVRNATRFPMLVQYPFLGSLTLHHKQWLTLTTRFDSVLENAEVIIVPALNGVENLNINKLSLL